MRDPEEHLATTAEKMGNGFFRGSLKEGGALAVLAAVVVLLLFFRQADIQSLKEEFEMSQSMAGSGTSARSTQFDLSTCVVPTETLMSGGPPKDGIPALTRPAHISSTEADALLRPEDRVIGVEFGGDGVAYPLRILNWHECVNDEVGGHAIAVTYCPLCDSAFVFARRVGNEILEFGISGMLLNSNVLLYDRQPDGKESSLWSQAAMQAVCGPAAAASSRLELIPSQSMTWGEWRKNSPETQVLSFDTGSLRAYSENPYKGYFDSAGLMFPVKDLHPSPESSPSLPDKEPVLVVKVGEVSRVYPYAFLERMTDSEGRVRDRIGDLDIPIRFNAKARTAYLDAAQTDSNKIASATTFWFAWRSLHRDYTVFNP